MIQITAQEELGRGVWRQLHRPESKSGSAGRQDPRCLLEVSSDAATSGQFENLAPSIGLNILALKILFPYAASQAIKSGQEKKRLATIPGIAASNTTLFEPVEWSKHQYDISRRCLDPPQS